MKISKFAVCLWMIDKSFSSSTYYQEMVINDLQLSDQVEEIKSVKAAIAILDEDMGSLDKIPWHTYVCGEDASVPLPRSQAYVIALEQMFLAAISLGKRSISGSQDELCLVMGHLDVKRFQSGKQVLGKLWRNQLAEHFVKYGKQYGIFVGHDSASLSRDATLKTLEEKLDASFEAFLFFMLTRCLELFMMHSKPLLKTHRRVSNSITYWRNGYVKIHSIEVQRVL